MRAELFGRGRPGVGSDETNGGPAAPLAANLRTHDKAASAKASLIVDDGINLAKLFHGFRPDSMIVGAIFAAGSYHSKNLKLLSRNCIGAGDYNVPGSISVAIEIVGLWIGARRDKEYRGERDEQPPHVSLHEGRAKSGRGHARVEAAGDRAAIPLRGLNKCGASIGPCNLVARQAVRRQDVTPTVVGEPPGGGVRVCPILLAGQLIFPIVRRGFLPMMFREASGAEQRAEQAKHR